MSNTLSGVVISSTGPLQDIIIQYGGARHTNGDTLRFTSASGTGATGVVTGTTGETISPRIVNGGKGYRVSNTIVTISGGDGSGANFRVTAISNTETVQTYDDVIADLSGTRINANTYITSNTGTISANLAIANSSTVLSAALGTSNTTVGSISGMEAITRGSNYTIAPAVTARDSGIYELRLPDGSGGFYGDNAQLAAELVAGALTNVSLTSFGSGYNRSDTVTIVNTSNLAAENATGAPLVTGTVSYPGKYIDTKGFVSWNNKIQDNYYYQEFSYSLRSTQSVNTYREIVKSVTHGAGTKLFGDHRISSNVSMSTTSYSYTKLSIDNVGISGKTAVVGTPTLVRYLDPTGISSTVSLENNNELIYNIAPISFTSTAFGNPYISSSIGGYSLISISPTAAFGNISTNVYIEPQSVVYNPYQPLSSAVITTYSSNTVSQLQSNTFNTLIFVPQVPSPEVV